MGSPSLIRPISSYEDLSQGNELEKRLEPSSVSVHRTVWENPKEVLDAHERNGWLIWRSL
jgi:hypothetical protein